MTKKALFIIPASAALIASLILSFAAYRRYRSDYIETVVAAEQISQRSLIDRSHLRKVLVPREYLGEDVYADEEDVLGKTVKLGHTIPEGCLFYKGFLEKGARDIMHTLLEEGQVSYDLYAGDLKANTAGLCEGMYVDLYLSVSLRDRPVSDLLVKDCRIIGLFDHSGKQIGNHDYDSKVGIISLAIGRDEVPLLNKALMVGSISMIASYDSYATGRYSKVNEDSAVMELLR